MSIKLKKDGTPDLRSFPKEVRNLVAEMQLQKQAAELEMVKDILSQESISLTDVAKMASVGTQSVFAGKVLTSSLN